MQNKHRYIITGGPGSGKTTVLECLRKMNFCCYDEISRKIIRKQQKIGGDSVPWINLNAFAEICYKQMLNLLDETKSNICFFDRGIPDIIAYLRRGKLNVPEYFYINHKKYNKTVFIAPPWRDIFVNDDERPETFEQSEELYKYLKNTYKYLEYKLIELPKISAEKRAEFIIEHLATNN